MVLLRIFQQESKTKRQNQLVLAKTKMKVIGSSTKIQIHLSLTDRRTTDQLGRRNKPIYHLMMNSSKLVRKEFTSTTSRQPRDQSLVIPKSLYMVDHSTKMVQNQSAGSVTKLFLVFSFLAQRDSPRSTRKKVQLMNVLHSVFNARTVHQSNSNAKIRTT